MSLRLLVMLIFISIRLKLKFMVNSSSLEHIEDCFYEKRVDTSLNGYNDLHDRWISELDCLDRCLKVKPHRCRSFEHWRSHRHGLCVRANISLTDQPSAIGTNSFVDYYELDCRKDTKAVRLQTTTCPGDQLQILVTLNGIDRNYVLLGDSGCIPKWSNETHAEFISHVDNCSLTLTDGSIVGKLRWEGVDKDNNEARQYERFFLCPSDLYQMRSAHWLSTTMKASTTSYSQSSIAPTSTRHRVSSPSLNDDPNASPTYKIYIQWVLHNRTYVCPQTCTVSLLSHIHVTFDDATLQSSKYLIESCDLIALYPYTHYLQTRQLINRGCPTDPTVIHFSSDLNALSTFSYSFYLYNIMKEPIPFQVQCKILNHEQRSLINHTNCSSPLIDNDPFSILRNDNRDNSYVLFRSSPVNVNRKMPSSISESETNTTPRSLAPMIAVHHTECSLLAFSFLIHWTFYSCTV